MGTATTAQMADPNCAPTDPAFFLQLTYMDYIWQRFRNTQTFDARELEYPLTNLGKLYHHIGLFVPEIGSYVMGCSTGADLLVTRYFWKARSNVYRVDWEWL